MDKLLLDEIVRACHERLESASVDFGRSPLREEQLVRAVLELSKERERLALLDEALRLVGTGRIRIMLHGAAIMGPGLAYVRKRGPMHQQWFEPFPAPYTGLTLANALSAAVQDGAV